MCVYEVSIESSKTSHLNSLGSAIMVNDIDVGKNVETRYRWCAYFSDRGITRREETRG